MSCVQVHSPAAASGMPQMWTMPLSWPVAKQSPRAPTQQAAVTASSTAPAAEAPGCCCLLMTATTHWCLHGDATWQNEGE